MRWLSKGLVACLALAAACGDTEQKSASTCHGARCSSSACRAPTAERCENACVNLSADPLHCGACDRACPTAMVCIEGSCHERCAGATPLRCGDSCVNPRTDPTHCGGCGRACGDGELCSAGECSPSCGADTPTACGGLCVDLDSNSRFCGACDHACAEGQVCVQGRCATECSGNRPLLCAGQCVDPRSDPRFCGGCDVACGSGQVCNDGICDDQCSGATPTACQGLCVDTLHDPNTCGGCGIHCRPGAVCEEGYCAAGCRDSSKTQCGDVCADLGVDPNHCGDCAVVCGAGTVCSDGACVAECAGATPIRCGPRCVRAVEQCPLLRGGDDAGGAGGAGGASDGEAHGGAMSEGGSAGTCASELLTNQIPALSGPDSAVSYSGNLGTGYEAWLAFDATASIWVSALGQTPAWLGYTWVDAPRFITRYAIYYANGEITTRAPRSWTLEARNDGAFTVIDSRVDEVGWLGHERREYDVQTPGAYREYRILVSDDNDPRPEIEVISIGALELIGAPCP